MKRARALFLVLLALGCSLVAPGQRAAAGSVDPDQDARLLVQELVSPESVQALRGQKLVLTELTVSDDTDKALAAAAKDFHASLQTALINSGFFKVVERAQLDRILRELKLELSDLSDPDQAQKVGKLANSDLILLGEMTKVDDRTRVSLRLVSIGTGVAIRAAERVISLGGADGVAVAAPSRSAERNGAVRAPSPGAEIKPAAGTVGVKPPARGEDRRGYLGIIYAELKPDMIDRVKVTQGVVVVDVLEGSPAESAGLQPYDVIEKADGRTVNAPHELAGEIRARVAGGAVSLSLMRAGEPVELTVTLGEAPVESVMELTGHEDSVASVAFSGDGKTLASASSDHTVRLWDARSGKLQRTLDAHTAAVNSVAFSPDGKTIATGGDDRTVNLWDAATGSVKQTLKLGAEVNSVAFSPDGRTLASATSDCAVRLWQPDTGVLQQTMKHSLPQVISVAFSPHSGILASAANNIANLYGSELKLWDPQTGRLERSLADNGQDRVTSLAFSPSGETLAAALSTGVKLWNATTGLLRRTLTGFGGQVDAVAFSPDGSTLASAGGGDLDLWDAQTGRKRFAVGHNQGRVNSLAFSPDGKVLASAGEGKTVKLWLLR